MIYGILEFRQNSLNSDGILRILKYHFRILDSILEFWFGILNDDQNSVSIEFDKSNHNEVLENIELHYFEKDSQHSSLSILGLGIWGENKEFFS